MTHRRTIARCAGLSAASIILAGGMTQAVLAQQSAAPPDWAPVEIGQQPEPAASPAELERLEASGEAARTARRVEDVNPVRSRYRRAPATDNVRRPAVRADFNGAAYRNQVGRLAGTGNLQALEQRGYDARRARPGSSVRGELDLRPGERLNLQRAGQQARLNRGVRPGFAPATQPVSAASKPKSPRPATGARIKAGSAATPRNRSPGARAGLRPPANPARSMAGSRPIRSTTQFAARSASVSNKAAVVDFGSEAFGGESAGLGEFGAAVTVGQFETFANGDDPVMAMGHASQALGHSLLGATHGIGQSILDPRRIPGNAQKAVRGVAETGVSVVSYAANKTAKTVTDGARFVTDPKYADKQIKYGARKVGETVTNIGKSTCKGFSTLLGIKKPKC